MSSYLNDSDAGNVQLDFKNGSGTIIGSTIISDPDFGPNNVWSQSSKVGTCTRGNRNRSRVNIWNSSPRRCGWIYRQGRRPSHEREKRFIIPRSQYNQWPDDSQEPDRHTCKRRLLPSYQCHGRLNSTAWNSFQEQNVAGFPAGNGSGNGWEQFGGSTANVIGESYLTGSSDVSNNAAINLGAAFNVGGAHNLIFSYGATARTGDYNNDGTVNAADYVLWRKKNGQNASLPNDLTSGTVNDDDYFVWRANFGNTTGASALVTGFVRYVTSGSGSGSAVPEPTGVVLAGLGFAFVAAAGRRKPSES